MRNLPLHAGLIIRIPNAEPALQRILFQGVVHYLDGRELVNAGLEVDEDGENMEIDEYDLP